MFQYALYQMLKIKEKNAKISTIHYDFAAENSHITEHGKKYLIENIFNTKLTTDVKSFILSILRIPIKDLEALAS